MERFLRISKLSLASEEAKEKLNQALIKLSNMATLIQFKIKESDRLTAVYESFKALGVDISKTDDGLVINKTGIVGGGAVSGYNDHRMVMALSVLSAVSSGDIILRGAEAVNKSYPNFFEDFSSLGGSYNVINS